MLSAIMSNSFSNILDRLKQASPIKSAPDFLAIIDNINRYCEQDTTKAYFLGYFFKHHFDSDNLGRVDKDFLIAEIKQRNLSNYFYLKEKPNANRFPIQLYVFILGGVVIIGIGIMQLTTGYFTFLVNSKYQTLVFQEGGYYLIFGLIW
jgi:hypothetical protein